MKKVIFFLLATLSAASLWAQLELIKQKPNTINGSGKIYALIIGISDYENIRDLEFADEDAQDFSDFLVKESGLGADPNNIKLLINKNATSANVGKELLKLKNRMEEGSTLFIYFAGHGDANGEAQAFLLASDLPKIEDPSLYAFNGGVIHVYFLKDEIRKIISERKSNVILVTDACRTNELAGSKEGMKTYVNKIMEQNNGEIQFISCAADEKSEEGVDWGQGRGVFSYFFVNGLRGLADNRPQDGKVTVRELFDYVQKNVEDATQVTDEETIAATGKAYRQSPQYCCTEKQSATLVLVNENVKQAAIAKMATSNYAIKLASRGRSVNNSIETNDTVLKALYEHFYTALDNKQLVSPKGNSAWDYYNEFKKRAGKNNPAVFDVTEDIKAALLNDAQNIINAFYSYTDKWGMSAKTKRNFYEEGVEKLRKARSLMAENDPLSPIVKLTRQCMEAAGIFASTQPDDWNRGMKMMDSAITMFPTNPLPLFLKGRLLYNAAQYDEALVYLRKSQSIAPRWSMPAIGIADVYYEKGEYDSVETLLLEIEEKQQFAMVYFKLGFFYGEARKNYSEAIDYNKRALELAPEKTNIINNIGAYYEQLGEYDSALAYFNRAFEADSNNAFTLKNIARYYVDRQEFSKAETVLKRAIIADSTEPSTYKNLGDINYEKSKWSTFNLGQKLKYWQTAVNYYEKAIQFEPKNQDAYYEKAKAEADMDITLAEKTMLRYLKLGKADATFYNNFGLVYKYGGDTAKATETFKKGIETDSLYRYPYYNLGEIYYENSQWDSAIIYYSKSNNLEYFSNIQYKIESAAQRIEEDATERERLESKEGYIREIDTNPDVWQPLAEIYYSNWQYDSAFIFYNKIIEANPDASEEIYSSYFTCAPSYSEEATKTARERIGKAAEDKISPALAYIFINAVKEVGDTTQIAQAETLFKLINQNDPEDYRLNEMAIWIAELYSYTTKNEGAIIWIEQALKLGYSTSYVEGNYNFYNLFENKKFKKLMKKYTKEQEKQNKKKNSEESWENNNER